MKKVIPIQILFIISILSFNNTFAQKKYSDADHERFFRIGGKAGVNVNKIQGQSFKSGFNYNYLLGGFMQFNFGRFGLQPEVNFAQGSSEFSRDATNIYDDLFRDGSQKNAKLNYLKIPLLLNINVGESKHVKLQLGPQYANVLKQVIDSLKKSGDIYKKADWSAVGGLWIQLPLINFGARYELGLTNLNGVDNKQTWKSQAITVFAGFTL
jgi:hypothetical protein